MYAEQQSFGASTYKESSVVFKLPPTGWLNLLPRDSALLPERVRSGLLAFDTGQGVAYAAPSLWQRVYLLWTFRNFPRLSHKVLNLRQQQLIDSLYYRSSFNVAEPHETVLIGTVEDINLPSPSPVLVVQATGKEEASAGRISPYYGKPHYGVRVFSGVRPIIAGALCVTIAIVAWHQWRPQPISFAWNAGNVTTIQPPANAVAIQKDTSRVIEHLLGTVSRNGERPISSPMPRLSAAERRESREKVPRQVNQREDDASPLAGRKTPEGALRIKISGAPLRLVYPTYPQIRVRGKVSLKAVVGCDGTVKEVRVLTGKQVLAAAAIEAIRQWRYDPYHKGGPALEAEANITVSFIARDVIAISFPVGAPGPNYEQF